VYEDRTVKLVDSILSREEGVRENDGGDEYNQVTMQACMEMSQ
jgi:hypothetical protein